MSYSITTNCVSCGACQNECPTDAISEGPGIYHINPEKCIDCGNCADVCPVNAAHPQ